MIDPVDTSPDEASVVVVVVVVAAVVVVVVAARVVGTRLLSRQKHLGHCSESCIHCMTEPGLQLHTRGEAHGVAQAHLSQPYSSVQYSTRALSGRQLQRMGPQVGAAVTTRRVVTGRVGARVVVVVGRNGFGTHLHIGQPYWS